MFQQSITFHFPLMQTHYVHSIQSFARGLPYLFLSLTRNLQPFGLCGDMEEHLVAQVRTNRTLLQRISRGGGHAHAEASCHRAPIAPSAPFLPPYTSLPIAPAPFQPSPIPLRRPPPPCLYTQESGEAG